MNKTAATLWTEYQDTSVVDRAEHFARYTVPSLMVDPLVGSGKETVRYDFQSSGSLLLNNLSSKLTSLLFPSNQPFFKNIITPELKAQATKANIATEVLESKLSILEQEATKNLFKNASFAKITKALKLVIATGQALVYRDTETQKFRVWNMRSFAVKRDAYGDWHCIILKQRFTFAELPTQLQNDAIAKFPGRFKPDSKLDMYTQIKKEYGSINPIVRVTTEIEGKLVGPHASYPSHLSPWVLPIWNLADGEDYARGLVEEYAGDFAKLSVLSEQLGLYELDSMEILNFVNQASGASVDDLREANSGDYLPGNGDSVHASEKGDYNKMNTIRASLGEVVQRLSQAFMYTGNTRNAERVTAEEIKKDAREAETMLGGAYSILAESFQSPLAYLMMREVSDKSISALITRAFYPQILTGLPALNRDIEVQNLLGALSSGAAVIPQIPVIDPRLDPQKIMDMLYRNSAVDTSALFKDEATMKADAEQATNQANAANAMQSAVAQPDQLQQIL